MTPGYYTTTAARLISDLAGSSGSSISAVFVAALVFSAVFVKALS